MFAKATGVQPVEQFGNSFVEIGEMEELAVTQRGYDPALCDLNPCLDLGFVARFIGTSGNYREAVMLGQLAISGIQFRFIAAGMLDCCFRVVGVMWRIALCGRDSRPHAGIGSPGRYGAT